MKNTIHQGDCLEIMKSIPDGSVDAVICDPPYGTTACKWDTIIPFEPLWEQYKRIIKDNGAIVLTASQPFTSALVMSNPDWFRYCWYWEKNTITGFANAKKQPLRCIEDIAVFYDERSIYNPQGIIKCGNVKKNGKSNSRNQGFANQKSTLGNGKIYVQNYTNYPRQILRFNREGKLHPTQKPVALFEYLIKTYTNEGDTVLDNCAGSGTTAIAARNTGRNYILIEKEQEYVNIINKRLSTPQ